jgi:2'-deoxynucleoside 5'-phosphate N-hydrolase
MKIYFAGSIRGGRNDSIVYKKIIDNLKEYGEVLTEHVGNENLLSLENNNKDEYIYKRDISLIEKSDVIVAEVTNPSLGVGYEIAYAEKLNKKIFCLYRQTENKKVSAMIAGNSNCEVIYYKEEEISKVLESIFT